LGGRGPGQWHRCLQEDRGKSGGSCRARGHGGPAFRTIQHLVPELPEVRDCPSRSRDRGGGAQGRRGPSAGTPNRSASSGCRADKRSRGPHPDCSGRLGKFLLLSLDDGSVLVVHLRMTGQLLYLSGLTAPHRSSTTHRGEVRGRHELRFIDPRTFGEWFVSSALDDRGVPVELGHLGRDPCWTDCLPPIFAERLAGRRARLKTLLTDQRVIAGIGASTRTRSVFGQSSGPTGREVP